MKFASLAYWGLIFSALSVPSVQAQAPHSSGAPYPAGGNAATLLWRISGQGLTQPSYLFGTMHVLCSDDAAIGAETVQAFGTTQQLVLELDMDAPKFEKQLFRALQLPWSLSLRKITKQREFREIKQFVKRRLHQPVLPYVLLLPSFSSAMIFTTSMPCKPVSLEEQFVKLASEQRKEVLGLETIDEQVGYMKRVPYPEQVKELLDAVRKYDVYMGELAVQTNAYRRRNVEEIYGLVTDTTKGVRPTDIAELAERNTNWVPRMMTRMAQAPTFFAVGAGHLGGSTGLLQLLKQQGYQLEPVFPGAGKPD